MGVSGVSRGGALPESTRISENSVDSSSWLKRNGTWAIVSSTELHDTLRVNDQIVRVDRRPGAGVASAEN
jgi:hypothetical protein